MLGSGAMRRLAIALALVALLLMPAAQARAQSPTDGDAYGASISAIDNVFTLEIVRIQPGQTVEWTMDGRSPHTVQADDGSWDSGNLEPGDEFAHTFGDAGVYPFFCRYHGKPGAGMAGTARAQYDLRRSCVFLDMHPLNKPEVLIGQAQTKFDASGRLTDDAARGFIRDMLVALEKWTRLIGRKN